MSFLKKLFDQANPFDNGKTWSNPQGNPRPVSKPAPAQTPPPSGMNFAGSKTYGTFNRPSPVVNAAQKQIAQTPKVNTKNRYAQVNAPSYGSGLSGLVNRAKDVVDANTPQDFYKRNQQVKAPLAPNQTYQQQQMAKGNMRPDQNIGQAFLGNTARAVNTSLALYKSTPDVIKAMNAKRTGNQTALNQSTNKILGNFKPTGGIFDAGTAYTANELKKDPKKAFTNYVGANIGAAGELAPIPATKAIKGANLATKVAKVGLASGTANTAADAGKQLIQTGKVNPTQSAQAFLTGGVMGVALPAGGAILSKSKQPVQSVLNDATRGISNKAGQLTDNLFTPHAFTPDGMSVPMPPVDAPNIKSEYIVDMPGGRQKSVADTNLTKVADDKLYSAARKELQKRQGQTITFPDGSVAEINSRTINELLRGKRLNEFGPEEYKDFLRSLGNLDEHIAISGKSRHVKNLKDSPPEFQKNGFDNREVNYSVNGRDRQNDIQVAKGDSQDILYQYVKSRVNKNNHLVGGVTDKSAPTYTNLGDYASNIPQTPQNVNPIRGLDRLKLNQQGSKVKDLPNPLPKNQSGFAKNPFYKDPNGKAVDPLEALKAEARKYKTVDEFVKSREKLYHGSNKTIDKLKPGTAIGNYGEKQIPGIYTTPDQQFAQWFAETNGVPINRPKELYASLNNPLEGENIKDIAKKLDVDPNDTQALADVAKSKGYDGIILNKQTSYKNGSVREVIPFDSTGLLTREQLSDLYNQAQTPPVQKLNIEQTPFGPVKKTETVTAEKYSAQSAVDRSQNPTVEMPQKLKSQSEQSLKSNKMPAKDTIDNASYSDNTLELPKYNTKKVGLLDRAFRSTRSIIERQGESGKKLAGMLQEQRDSKELWLRDIEKRLPNAQKLKDSEFENFIESTQGNANPMNGKVASAVEEWKSVHPEIRQRGVDAGLDIGDLGETYYPHFIDYEKVFKNQNTYNEAINHLVKTGQAPTQEEAIKLLSYARDVSRNRQFGNLEASRLVDLPFYDKSKKSLATYLQGSADRITKTELFGKGDEKAIKLIKNIAIEGGDTEAAKNAFDVAVGAKQYNPTASKISGGIRHYTTVTRLGLGALTNMSQSVNTGIVTGHIRTLGAVMKQLSPKARQFADDTGVISDAILDDIKRGVGYESFGSSTLGKGINLITAPGFKQVESFNRRVAATAGKDYALRLAQKGDEATLRKLGITGAIKNNTLTTTQQIQAARKIVEKTQFKVDAQDLPGWADSPGGKLVAQFRTFSYNQGKFFSNEILKPLGKGNVMPLGRLLAALPLGYALYETRRRIDGRPEEENKSKLALSSFQKIGGAGLALDIYQGLNPLGSQYLPSDRRVSLAASVFGGPSVGMATNLVGSLSDVIQRKNTPADESKLGGKVALFNDGDKYTDATAISRFGLQQIPIVGSPIMNRALPYKKQSEAETGKVATAESVTANRTDQMADAKKTIKNLYGKEWANMKESDIEDKALQGDQKALEVFNSLKAQENIYAKPNMKTPGLSQGAENILNQEKKFTDTGKKAWGNRPTDNKEPKDAIKSWVGQDVPVTNDVAVEWAKFEKKRVAGEYSPLELNEAKTSLARKAVSSQLNEDERQYYNVSDDKLIDALNKGWITPDSLAKAMDIDKQLLSMGLTSKSGFGKKVWTALGIAYPSVSGASSSTRSSGRRTARKSTKSTKAPKLSYSTTKVKSRRSSMNSSLRKLLGYAKV